MHSQGKAKNIILKVVITLCILAGILTWVPNLVLGRTDFYWLATIPLGIVALISSMALVVEKKISKNSLCSAKCCATPQLSYTDVYWNGI